MSDMGKANYEGYCAATDGKSLVSGAVLPPWEDLKPAIRHAWDAGADTVEQWLSELPVDEDMPGNEPAKVIIVTEAGGYRRRYELPDFGQLHGGELILGRKQDGSDVKVEVMYPPGEWKHVARDGAEVPDATKRALDIAKRALGEIANPADETVSDLAEDLMSIANVALGDIWTETEG